MRKAAACLVLLLLMFLCLPASSSAESGFTPVYVNGNRINVFPVIRDGVVYLPPQALAQAIGASIKYDYSLNILKVNDIMVAATPYTPPDGQVMVPAEAICQTIGGTLEWDGQTRAIRITTPRPGALPPAAQSPTSPIPATNPASFTPDTRPSSPYNAPSSPDAAASKAPANPYMAQTSPTYQPAGSQPSSSSTNPYQAQASPTYQPAGSQPSTPGTATSPGQPTSYTPPPSSGTDSLTYYPPGIIPITTRNSNTPTTSSPYSPPPAATQTPSGGTQTPYPQDTMNYNPTVPQAKFPTGSIYEQSYQQPINTSRTPTSAPAQTPASVQQLPQATIYNPPGVIPVSPTSSSPALSTDIFRPVSASNAVFSVTVTNIETMNTIKDYYRPKPGHKFVTVYLSQQNVSNEVQIYTGRFSMLDQTNTSYDYAEQLSNFWLIILKPGGINFGYLVFEVPQDARPSRLLLHALNQAPLSLNL
jgi:hypothetical protein